VKQQIMVMDADHAMYSDDTDRTRSHPGLPRRPLTAFVKNGLDVK